MPLHKKVFFKVSENLQETPVPEETIVNFARTIPDDCFWNADITKTKQEK